MRPAIEGAMRCSAPLVATGESGLREPLQFGGNSEAAGPWVLQPDHTVDVVDLLVPLSKYPHTDDGGPGEVVEGHVFTGLSLRQLDKCRSTRLARPNHRHGPDTLREHGVIEEQPWLQLEAVHETVNG